VTLYCEEVEKPSTKRLLTLWYIEITRTLSNTPDVHLVLRLLCTSSSKKTLRIWAIFLFGECIWHIKSWWM